MNSHIINAILDRRNHCCSCLLLRNSKHAEKTGMNTKNSESGAEDFRMRQHTIEKNPESIQWNFRDSYVES